MAASPLACEAVLAENTELQSENARLRRRLTAERQRCADVAAEWVRADTREYIGGESEFWFEADDAADDIRQRILAEPEA